MNRGNRWRVERGIFAASWLIVWLGLNVMFAVLALRNVTSLSISAFMLGQLLNLGVSYGLVQGIASLLSPPVWPARLGLGCPQPRVAVLYTTCDDLQIAALGSLCRQRYPNYDVFVLDDSRGADSQKAVEAAAAEHGVRYVHRDENSGFKAGSLNNWLGSFSADYKYFAIADADSILPEDFLVRMVQYAEHPENRGIAVFQSKLAPWNSEDYLSTCETATLPITHWKADRLLNRYGYLSCWGHNALYRCREIRELGGFDEAYSSEDLALAIDLLNRGHRSCLVDVVSFEKAPQTFDEYAQRSARWARQTIQLLLYKPKGALSLLSCAHLFMDAFGFVMPVLFAVGAFLVTWSGTSSVRDFGAIHVLARLPQLPLVGALVFVYLLALFFDLPAAVVTRGVSVRRYFVALWLRLLLSLYSLAPIARSLAEALLSRRPRFRPTGSSWPVPAVGARHLWRVVYLSAFVLGLGVGILRNPLVVLFNWFWILPMLTAPIAVLWISGRHARPKEAGL